MWLLGLAAILLAIRLPLFMTRLGMSKSEKIAFVATIFSILGFGWFVIEGFGIFRFLMQ